MPKSARALITIGLLVASTFVVYYYGNVEQASLVSLFVRVHARCVCKIACTAPVDKRWRVPFVALCSSLRWPMNWSKSDVALLGAACLRIELH